jgi:putative transposase
VTKRLDLACEPLRSWAGLHANDCWGRAFKELKQRVPPETDTLNRSAGSVDPDNMEEVLADIDTVDCGITRLVAHCHIDLLSSQDEVSGYGWGTGRTIPLALRPGRKRKLVGVICEEWKVSIRRACAALEFDRSTFHYRSRKRDQAGVEARIKAICETRVRYGYRRVHVMLQREGWNINIKRTYRIYNKMGLQLRNKTPKRRVKAKLRDDRAPATRPNDVWAMDFVQDQLATGKTIRVLTVVDTFSRFSPVIDPRFSYRAEDVVATLERVCGKTGYPKTIRVDQGSEFVSRDLDLWAYAKGVTLDFSRPGKPTDNAFIEAFNGRFRSECLL